MLSRPSNRSIPALFLLLALLCCSAILSSKVYAGSEGVRLLPGSDAISVSAMRYLEDRDQTVSADQFYQRLRAGSVEDAAVMPFNLGSTTSRYLLGFSIQNKSDQAQPLQFATGASYRPGLTLDVYTEDGSKMTILEENHSLPFTQRNNTYRHLNSDVFSVSAQQTVTVVLDYQTIGSTYLPLTLGSPQAISDLLNKDAQTAAFFYSFCAAALVMFALFGAAMSDKTTVLYALLFLLGLLTIASMEGFAFKILWPEMPGWNHYSPLVLLYALAAFGLWVARYALLPNDNNRRIRSVMLGAAMVSAAIIPTIGVLDFVMLASLSNLFMLLMIFAHVYTMSTWLTLDKQRNHVAIYTAALVAVVVTVLILTSLDNELLPAQLYIQSTRLIYLVIMLATITVMTTHVRTLQRNHERALQDAVSAAEREAEVSRELFHAQQKYSRARELASLRQQQLATASHDMKQPLVSLRATIDTLAQEQAPETRNQLINAFTYLDKLCTHYLKETHPDEVDEGLEESIEPEGDESVTEAQEPYSINLILSTAEKMFQQEAEQKNINLHTQPSSVQITQSPMILMRLYTNLVSNAVRHTEQGRILLGARRRPNAVCLQVLDTGPGIASEQLASITQAYHKGPDSEGSGLGLAICQQLAQENGLGFDIFSQPGRGTVCQITIPL